MRRLIASLLALTLSACAMVPMDPTKPVEKKPFGFGERYYQDGKELNPYSMLDVLSEDPSTREEFGHTKEIHYASLVIAGVGGYMVGYNSVSRVGETDDQATARRTNMSIGLGLAVIGIGMGAYVGSRVNSALETYNKSKGAKSGWLPRFDLDPSRNAAGLSFAKTF